MKKIVGCLCLCFCFATMFGPGMVPCCAQQGLVEDRGPIGPLLIGPTEAELVPSPPPQPAVNIWIEAIFIEMDRAITRDFEKAIGFKLSPPDGKVIVNAEEKEKILASVEELEQARVLFSLTVLTISGQQVQTEQSDEIIFATEYECKDGTLIPGNWEKRDVGAVLNVTPIVGEDGLITLVLMPEISVLGEWLEIQGTDVTQPVFKTWSTTTTVHMPDGSAFVLKDSPYLPFHLSQASNAGQEVAPENQKTLLVIVSAKIVEPK
jgi:hypothetical protein